jgi:hypothetical protein
LRAFDATRPPPSPPPGAEIDYQVDRMMLGYALPR